MIREATEDDLQNILEIYNDAIINTTAVYQYKAHSLEDRKIWYNKKKEEGYPVLVFEGDEKVLGFATFGPFRAWPAYKYTIEHSVYVDRNARNKGVGTALMKAIIKIANEREFATLVAGIDEANEESIKIHEKLGFRFSGKIEKAGYKFGKWLNLVFYQLDLIGPKVPIEE
ncbi:GNAT family N-acetyltransferase [Clostridium formicaceticum]|uniref:N-acetyltransferase n=1 Tax=Clostridium formicaceticum TaxID=1497 RepID=A0AAC9WH67_9CLOT|nr:GNAT family N-acetyltransferase [Clostridium formicaceticum]AOY77982.1 N-acetyltransferase [Clostridium formicaceticum]ARE88606.1 N-acyltransferase YncA [Clostridium formicaceticum]